MPFKSRIRTIADYPRPGLVFPDITSLLKDAAGFRRTVEALAERYAGQRIDKVASIEARGFMIGAPLALRLGAGFVLIRKRGKLPADTVGRDYEFEHGVGRVEMHTDAIEPGERVLLLDDQLATGGTADAACSLIEDAGGQIVECCFVIELSTLGGQRRLGQRGLAVFSLCAFGG
jgi:adenine phosphoribosyltransferase